MSVSSFKSKVNFFDLNRDFVCFSVICQDNSALMRYFEPQSERSEPADLFGKSLSSFLLSSLSSYF